MNILVLLVGMLAVWRATYMLMSEDGPRGIFARIQAWAARRPDKIGGINQGFYCFYCLSMWVSFLFALIIEHHNLLNFVVVWFALSAGAIFLNLIHNRIEQ